MPRLLRTLATVVPALALAMLLLPPAGWAQEPTPEPAPTPGTAPTPVAEEPAAPASGEYVPYTSADFGFSVSLPASGRILDPASETWNESKNVALWWLSANGEPVKAIQVRVDDFKAPLTEDIFKAFCTTLLSNWSEDPARFTVYARNLALSLGGQNWNLIEVSDNAHESGAVVYYSVFSAYSGSQIYTITLYYVMETNDAIRAFGKPVIQSFKLIPGAETE